MSRLPRVPFFSRFPSSIFSFIVTCSFPFLPHRPSFDDSTAHSLFSRSRALSFDGTGTEIDADIWISTIREQLELAVTPPEFWVEFASSQLTGLASSWWTSTRESLPEGQRTSWIVFEDRFHGWFFSAHFRHRKAQEYKHEAEPTQSGPVQNELQHRSKTPYQRINYPQKSDSSQFVSSRQVSRKTTVCFFCGEEGHKRSKCLKHKKKKDSRKYFQRRHQQRPNP